MSGIRDCPELGALTLFSYSNIFFPVLSVVSMKLEAESICFQRMTCSAEEVWYKYSDLYTTPVAIGQPTVVISTWKPFQVIADKYVANK